VVLSITDSKYSNTTQNFTQKDYFDYLNKFQRRYGEGQTIKDVLAEQWDGFVNAMLIDFEREILPAKYEDFIALLQEYHDGILLFDLMDEKVWSKAVKDTAGLEAFYENKKTNYMWGERVDASVYLCENEAIAKSTIKMAKKRLKKGYADNDIIEKVNKENPLNLTIRSGLYAKGDGDCIDMVNWAEGITQLDGENSKKVIVQIYSVMEPQPKALQECRGLVTSDYQSYLEKSWIEELRAKYAFDIDMEVFRSIEK
jgi:peptidyl-prolyl cis-trans isomerase SurA